MAARARSFGPAEPIESGAVRIAVRTTADRLLLRAFLERDRLYAAYPICNLDEREFRRTRWAVAHRRDEAIAVAMEYAGPSPQPLFLMGEAAGTEALLRDLVRPRHCYVDALPDVAPVVEGLYRLDPGPPMVRMWVDRARFRPYPGNVERLGPGEVGDLNRLYELGFMSWLPSQAVAEGVYCGLRVDGRLVAAAGTHVISLSARLAAVGNVMTAQPYRGRGYAKATTSAVTAELLRTCDQVVLNVRSDNLPAIAAYAALGYREHVRFEQRVAHRRGSPWDGIMEPLRRLIGE